MIVVDTSVWIDHLQSRDTPAVRRLRGIGRARDIVVGDIILLEVLRGARDEGHAARIEADLRTFRIEAMLDDRLAVRSAVIYRELRRRGITIRSLPDLVIAAFCIDRGYALLHDDRDYEPIAQHLGLMIR